MGLFAKLFRKKSEIFDYAEYTGFKNEMRAHASKVVQNCLYLKSIGREEEAIENARAFIKEIASNLVIWDAVRYGLFLSILYDSACKLGEEAFALAMLDAAINGLQEIAVKGPDCGFPIKDLTQAYNKAGMLAERLPDDLQRAYRYYCMAIEAPQPSGRRTPAIDRQKAAIHAQAKQICDKLVDADLLDSGWKHRSDWHNKEMRRLVPSRNWDDPYPSNPGI
jgi:tetratricopeptide (TPR) repeat protein